MWENVYQAKRIIKTNIRLSQWMLGWVGVWASMCYCQTAHTTKFDP